MLRDNGEAADSYLGCSRTKEYDKTKIEISSMSRTPRTSLAKPMRILVGKR